MGYSGKDWCGEWVEALYPPPHFWKDKLRHKLQTPGDTLLPRKPSLLTSYLSTFTYFLFSFFSLWWQFWGGRLGPPTNTHVLHKHWGIPHNLCMSLHHPQASVPSQLSRGLVKISPEEELSPGAQWQAVSSMHEEFGGHCGAQAVGMEVFVRDPRNEGNQLSASGPRAERGREGWMGGRKGEGREGRRERYDAVKRGRAQNTLGRIKQLLLFPENHCWTSFEKYASFSPFLVIEPRPWHVLSVFPMRTSNIWSCRYHWQQQ